MGYRLYLATLDKTVADTLGDITLDAFLQAHGKDYGDGEIETPSPYDLPTHEKVFELGKYVDQEFTSVILGEQPIPLFGNDALNDAFEDYCVHRVGKAELLDLIRSHQKRIATGYRDMLTFSEKDRYRYYEGADLAFKHRRFFESRAENWESTFVDYLDTDEKNPHTLSHFWEYEYQVFNLIHVLKTLDWENKQLIVYGY